MGRQMVANNIQGLDKRIFTKIIVAVEINPKL
jgi:hypothetical protein